MQLQFDITLAFPYKSSSQKIRVMSESWIIANAYCAACGASLLQFPNNNPFADVFCSQCGEEYEIKCTKNEIIKKINDGAYAKMIGKILAGTSPNLFLLQYKPDLYAVSALTLIPRQFIIPEIVIKRTPLGMNARRKGWVGCFIDSERIPLSGKIGILSNGKEVTRSEVLRRYQKVRFIESDKPALRGWTMDVMRCIEKIGCSAFTLADIYQYKNELSVLHPANKNIEAKIRQQLQFLRDAGYIAFLGCGHYRLQ